MRLQLLVLISLHILLNACMHTDILHLDPQVTYEPSSGTSFIFSAEGADENLKPIAIIEVTSPSLGSHSRTKILERMRDEAQTIGADAVFVVTSSQQYVPPTYTSNIDGSLLTIPGGFERSMLGIALRHKDRIGLEEPQLMQSRPGVLVNGGLSFNLLSPFLSGYGFSGWLGRNRFRAAIDYYEVNIPKAMSRDGFNEGKVENAIRITFDYFLLDNLAGPYFGTGLQFANYSSGHVDTIERGEWESIDLTMSFGYKLNLSQNFHLDTRLALDLVLFGEEYIRVGGRRMYPDEAKVYGLVGLGLNF